MTIEALESYLPTEIPAGLSTESAEVQEDLFVFMVSDPLEQDCLMFSVDDEEESVALTMNVYVQPTEENKALIKAILAAALPLVESNLPFPEDDDEDEDEEEEDDDDVEDEDEEDDD